MNKMNLNSIKSIYSKWLVFMVFAIAVVMGFIEINRYYTPIVESYKFTETFNNSSIEFGVIDRAGLPFKFLFANGVKSPFSFDINLGERPKKGSRSLWVYAAQADNHGQLAIKYEGKQIGVVDNQLTEKNSAPVPKLSYVSDVNIAGGDFVLNFTGSNHKLDYHFAELGLVVLAPQGMSEENVIGSILSGRNGVPAADFGLFLFILASAYGTLIIFTKYNYSNKKNILNEFIAASVLLIICFFSYFTGVSITPPPLLNGYVSVRTGLERQIDSGFKNVVSEIRKLQSEILPNRQNNDDVPERLQLNAGSFETNIYRINQEAGFDKISKQIFSGKMADIQDMPVDRFSSLAFWILISILISLLLNRLFFSWWSTTVALGLISTLSILVSIRLSEGWDEFFINLRHAYMLLHHGVYSINANSMIEATVDLIPLLATTLMGRMGIELVDAFIAVSLLGNICVVVFSYLLVKKLTQDRTWALLAALLAGLYPNVGWVGASGFSAVLFSGWAIAASYFILFTDRRLLGLVLLAALTLVRTEGILFAALLMTYVYVVKPLPDIVRTGKWKATIKRAIVDGSIVATPFVLSLLVRQMVFGHAIPNPIAFKNTNFDSSFFASGLYRFNEMISNHDLHLVVLIIALLFLANFIAWNNNNKLDAWRIGVNKLLTLNLLMFLFILPYYAGGGDWFPVRWNRYGLPFNLVLLLTFMVLLYGAFFLGLKKWVRSTGLFIFSLALVIGYQKSAQFRQDNYIYSTLPMVIHPFGARWQRIDNLASLGQFLRDFLPADAVVSSPEEATIMYFSEREMMGLLGVSNPDMTTMPFQPLNPGNILHRRRGYASVFKTRPDVIALYEPVIVGDFVNNDSLSNKIHHALQNEMFNSDMVDIAYYRVGSFKALEKMGYRHVSISYSDRIFSLFIGERIYDNFVKNILAKGFKELSVDSIRYSVNTDISKKYVPAVKEVMSTL